MPKKNSLPAFKAKLQKVADGEYAVLVFVNRIWRIMGTPYAIQRECVKPFTKPKAARRAADAFADSFGIQLDWEVPA